MNSLLVLLRYKLLIAWRQIEDNLFTLGALGPMILFVVYLIVAPYMRALALGVYAPPSYHLAELIVAPFILLLLLGSTAAAAEFYPTQSPDSYLDHLPIAMGWRFCALALMRVAKNLPLAIALSVCHYFIAKAAQRAPQLGDLWLRSLLPALIQLAALQIMVALIAAHFGFLRISRLLPLLGSLYVIGAALPGADKIVFLPIAGIKNIFISLLFNWFARPVDAAGYYWLISLLLAAVYFSIAFIAYQRWAALDREAVERALGSRRRARFISRLTEIVANWSDEKTAAQLFRDLILTFRFFSSAVFLSMAIAALCEMGLVIFSLRIARSGEWFDIAAQATCALAAFALSALAPTLVKHQLPFLWIERSMPVASKEMYQNKLCYAGLISLPAPLASFIVALTFGAFDLPTAAFLLLKLILVWLMVASITGAMAFEISTRPGLAILFTAIASLAAASVIIRAWYLWLIIYPYMMSKLIERARQRAYALLIGVEGEND